MVSIDSARVVFYSTSIDAIIVSVTIFTIFDVQFWWLWSRPVQGHPGSKYTRPIKSPLLASYLTSFESNIVSVFIFEICDLDLGWFKVIQGQRSCCQSIAYGLFPIWLLLTPSSCLSPVLKYLTCNFEDLQGFIQYSSGSSKVKNYCANRKPIDGFLHDLHCVQNCVSHGIRDIW